MKRIITKQITKKDTVLVSRTLLRDLDDKYNELFSKIWFLENSVSNYDEFHERAQNGYHYFFQSVLEEMEDIEKILNQVYASPLCQTAPNISG